MYNPRRVFAPLFILIPLKIHECIQVYFSPPLHEVFCQNILTCERSKMYITARIINIKNPGSISTCLHSVNSSNFS